MARTCNKGTAMSDLIYRLGTEDDFEVVAEMYTKLDTFFRDLDLRLPKPDDVGQAWLDSFTRTIGRFSILHIAELEGEVVGFMLSRIKRVPHYWGGVLVGTLSDMWIRKKARRMGIGDRLSRNALEWLRGEGAHSIEIQVLESNVASWKLYENMGFKPELRQARLLWEDYIEPDE